MTKYNCLDAEHVGDAITDAEIREWKPGEIKIVNAAMSKGKTFFVENILYNYAKENDCKCLILTPRKALQKQIWSRSRGKIEVWTYQLLENMMQEAITSNETGYKDNIANVIAGLQSFRYIICDEFHYWLSDSSFNSRVQYSYDLVVNHTDFATKVMLSATSYDIEAYFDANNVQYEKYQFDISYNCAANITFFEDRNNIYDYIKNGIQSGKKTMVFKERASDANDLYTWCKAEGYTAQLVTSTSRYRDNMDKRKEQYLIKNERFKDDVLIATRRLECGINIKDEDVKQIIVDIFDIVAAVQCIGRKRAKSSTDKVDLFICIPRGEQLGGHVAHIKNTLLKVKNFEEDPAAYINKNNRDTAWTADGIIYPISTTRPVSYDGDYQLYSHKINHLQHFQYKKIWERIVEIKRQGYPKIFLQYLQTDTPVCIEDDVKRVEGYLDALCGDKDAYIIAGKQNREKFVTELNIRKERKLVKGLSSINKFLEEKELSFTLQSYDARPLGGSRYSWRLTRL